MVYGRQVGDRELNFEASGALMSASLVMRDRETDSWWSIMTSDAIDGALEGADLVELPYGEKTTWGEWTRRHPDTSILSVDGEEHELENSYDDYFASEETYRDLQIDDQRLPPKEHVYSFWLDGQPVAVAHRSIEGGALHEVGGRTLLFFRPAGASFQASSEAWVLGDSAPEDGSPADLAAAARGESLPGAERLPGFDTFWYSWVAVNGESELVE